MIRNPLMLLVFVIFQTTFALAQNDSLSTDRINALLSPEFHQVLKQKFVRLITYRDLIQRVGLKNMKRPPEKGD